LGQVAYLRSVNAS